MLRLSQIKPVPNFPGYWVTDDGRVKSTRHGQRWLKPGTNRGGYLRVVLRNCGRNINYSVHRLVLETFVGPCPDGMEACHNDSNPLNNRVENLRWDTKSANQLDAVLRGSATGLKNRGAAHGCAKLTEAEVRWIDYLHKAGIIDKELAEFYGVTTGQIRHIIKHRTWKYLWI